MTHFLTSTVLSLLASSFVALFPHPLIAAPRRSLSLTMPSDPLLPSSPVTPLSKPSSPFQPAPLPNRDVDTPLGPRADTAPSVGPSLFTRGDTYRGEGFNQGSTAQTEQEKRSRPAPGFSLKMPLTGN